MEVRKFEEILKNNKMQEVSKWFDMSVEFINKVL